MHTYRSTALAVALIGALAVAGCSSDTGSDGTSASGAAEASSTCVTEAEASVEKAKQPVALQAPETPIDVDAAKGAVIAYIPLLINEYTTDVQNGLDRAAKSVGASIVGFDPQGSVNDAGADIEQAIAQGVDGIVLLSVDHALIATQLQAAADAGVPVVTLTSSTLNDPVPDTVAAVITGDYENDARAGAAWTMANSDCAADVAIVTANLVGVFKLATEGAQSAYTEICGDACRVTVLDADLANAATDIPTQVTTALQKGPGITDVFAVWDGAVPLVAPAVVSSSSDANIMGMDGVPASLKAIATDNGQDFTMAKPPASWQGWAAFDLIIHAAQGLPNRDYVLDARLIDSSNIGDGTDDTVSPEYVGFEKVFTTAWGLK